MHPRDTLAARSLAADWTGNAHGALGRIAIGPTNVANHDTRDRHTDPEFRRYVCREFSILGRALEYPPNKRVMNAMKQNRGPNAVRR